MHRTKGLQRLFVKGIFLKTHLPPFNVVYWSPMVGLIQLSLDFNVNWGGGEGYN